VEKTLVAAAVATASLPARPADPELFYKGAPSYEFALSVRNLFDERYVEGADRSSAIAQFGSPTAWLLSVRHRFGEQSVR
jgi:hypothetical protein